MKQNLVPGIVLIGALVVCLLGWFILPALEDAQRAVDAEAGVHVERARRLLDKYNHGLTYKDLLLDSLADVDVDVDIEDPDALIDAFGDEYQEKHGRQWEDHPPADYDFPNPPRNARASYGNLPGQVRDGIEARDSLIEENEVLLKEALDEVNEALAVTSGNANAASNVEANRLKAVILFHQGLARRLEADLGRQRTEPHRRALASLGILVAAAPSQEAALSDTGIDERTTLLREKATAAEANLGTLRDRRGSLEDVIQDMENRLAGETARRDEARDLYEAIRHDGVDFADPNGGEVFQARLLEQDRTFREAARAVKVIEFGSLPTAVIDGSGDYLSGKFVENGSTADLTVEYGLTHFRNECAVVSAKLAEEEHALDDLRSDIARLEGIRNEHQADHDRTVQGLNQAIANAPLALAEITDIEAEALAVEDEALELFNQSIQASGRAARAAGEWVRSAGDMTRDLSSEVSARSAYGQRRQAGWMGGYIAAQTADAHMARAWIFYRRFSAQSRNVELLGRVAGPLKLSDVDLEAEAELAAEAHDLGVDEVSEAVAVLQRAHREADKHWTIVAQLAGANHLMALFGHPEYIESAIEAYRNAIQGREDRGYVQKLATCLRRLENR